ncbi:P27 family phage terminase small subunit [Lederbergia citri]|uniref:P27 family phage terminase small subunit n=1 Tax=Lederbergia citri TaxID=2833580 RepID=A0A942TD95_9BACI|nr:P27 family phage terminase small subunit [Lederbergia citri]MBS4194352.1 P27 family phage terminase small subunit [Lederbergia citri]
MNKKIMGTHNDSNITRAKKKQEQAEEFKKNLPQTDLSEVPKGFFLQNEIMYKILIKELENIGATHLIGIDKFSLVSIANTFNLLNEAEKIIARTGMTQELVTREGAVKVIPNPMLQQRNTLINTLNNQLRSLQLDPTSRRELIETVSNDISNIKFDDDDESIIKLLLEGAE